MMSTVWLILREDVYFMVDTLYDWWYKKILKKIYKKICSGIKTLPIQSKIYIVTNILRNPNSWSYCEMHIKKNCFHNLWPISLYIFTCILFLDSIWISQWVSSVNRQISYCTSSHKKELVFEKKKKKFTRAEVWIIKEPEIKRVGQS